MPSNEPSASRSWPAKEERSPLARPGSKWGGRLGQPEKMERATRNGPPKPSCPVSEGEKDSGFSGIDPRRGLAITTPLLGEGLWESIGRGCWMEVNGAGGAGRWASRWE